MNPTVIFPYGDEGRFPARWFCVSTEFVGFETFVSLEKCKIKLMHILPIFIYQVFQILRIYVQLFHITYRHAGPST